MMECLLERKKSITIGFLVLLAAAAFSAISTQLSESMEAVVLKSNRFLGRRDLSVSTDGVDVGRITSVRRKVLRKQKIIFDPKTVVIKPVQGSTSLRGKSWKDATIFDDGTYLLFEDEHRRGNYCETIINNKNRIKRMHYHAGSCKRFDSQFGNRLGTVYGMKMVANALRSFSFHL
eukprot:CCRYP_016774-RA/>CCRYP_016774-RA protein AED:0.46 eAED:0.46 QI:0/-1/0/1/-1/1/1/0/175